MASSTDPRVARLIDAYSQKYDVDPRAVKANALGEGGIHFGAVGDHGTSFGPFQLHIGGALPRQYSTSAAAASAFANSPAGIEYAIRKMAESGAAGLQGADAVASIVSNFEKPADIPGQIAARVKNLGLVGSTGGQAPMTPNGGRASLTPNGGMSKQQALAGFLLSFAQNAAEGKMPDFGSIAQLAQMQFGPAQVDMLPANTGTKAVKASGGVTWEGSPLEGEHPDFVDKVAQAAKASGATRVRVISGYRSPEHNQAVGGASRSNHTVGRAMDGEAFVPGKGWLPLGTLLKGSAGQWGLRSGDQPGFFNGRPDPNHVDDAYNQRT